VSATRAALATRRLVLEPVSAQLASRIVAGDLSGVRPANGWPHANTLDALHATVTTGADDCWLITLTATGEVIGDCGVKGPPDSAGTMEIGYGLARPWWGRGYGREAVGALMAWAFAQPGCQRLTAEVHQDNLASRHLLERLGFGIDGVVGGYVWYTLDSEEAAAAAGQGLRRTCRS
jgi:RimJ/RimL family protein N-acetyltransferase